MEDYQFHWWKASQSFSGATSRKPLANIARAGCVNRLYGAPFSGKSALIRQAVKRISEASELPVSFLYVDLQDKAPNRAFWNSLQISEGNNEFSVFDVIEAPSEDLIKYDNALERVLEYSLPTLLRGRLLIIVVIERCDGTANKDRLEADLNEIFQREVFSPLERHN